MVSAPAGDVQTGGDVHISGVPVPVTAAAPAGYLNTGPGAPPAQATVTAPSGMVAITAPGPAAAITVAPPAIPGWVVLVPPRYLRWASRIHPRPQRRRHKEE